MQISLFESGFAFTQCELMSGFVSSNNDNWWMNLLAVKDLLIYNMFQFGYCVLVTINFFEGMSDSKSSFQGNNISHALISWGIHIEFTFENQKRSCQNQQKNEQT